MIAKSAAKIIQQATAKLTRLCRNETLFRIAGEGKLGEWRTIKHKYNSEVAAYLRGKYAGVIIANEDIAIAANDWVLINENGCDK